VPGRPDPFAGEPAQNVMPRVEELATVAGVEVTAGMPVRARPFGWDDPDDGDVTLDVEWLQGPLETWLIDRDGLTYTKYLVDGHAVAPATIEPADA